MIPKKFIEYYGDAVRWYTGKVVSLNDPLQLARIQVRIHGIHTDNEILIPNEDLPWAPVLASTDKRQNTLGIPVGAFVFGFFLDGKNSQIPLILGTISQEGNTNPASVGTHNKYDPDSKINEPEDPSAAVYPNNLVYETSAGHVKEYDNTDSAERIREFHKSGTFYQVNPTGDFIEHIVKDRYTVIAGNDAIHISGNVTIIVDNDVKLTAKNVTVDADNVNVTGAGGDVIVDGVSLVNHTHKHQDTPGLQDGIADTFKPNKG